MIESQLYNNAFDVKIWRDKDNIELLQRTLQRMEAIIDKYLANIQTDFPQLTDHSLRHSNMLWEYANIIVGPNNGYLNPVEGFILHAVFLIHDAGMCYSTLNNKEEIEKDNIYLDYLTRYGQNDKNKEEALFYTVRYRHGDYAERIAQERLKYDEFLIEDDNLREELGLFIGKIAKSHTKNINYIEEEFNINYTVPSFPVDWSINCQKLALILRCADAAHLDNLRTPKSFKMIAEIQGVSQHHWSFQKKIGFPSLAENNLLMYSTNRPFKINEQKAWWYCYDALKVLDRELRNSNEFFNSKNQEGFNAIGVKFINDTLTLGKKYLKTEGWDALDTSVKVSNPIHIAAELGGVKLYGNIAFAVRELLQNSIDAINLYRFHTDQNSNKVGEINISLIKENKDYFLNISDNGIGMSENLITNELLDFGGSYWKSNKFNFEFEGLRSKGFDSIGKFGIGFFSAFMLGDNLKVTSWKFGEAIDKLRTLDFYDGLYSSPIFRTPTSDEKKKVIERGTSINIKLVLDPNKEKGLLVSYNFKDPSLYNIVRYFAPMTNVKINIEEIDKSIKTIEPNEVLKYDLADLLDCLCIPSDGNYDHGQVEFFKKSTLPLDEIVIEGKVIGRLSLQPIGGRIITSTGIVVSKGIRVKELSGLIGYIFVDEIITLKRDNFSCNISFEAIQNWAKKQITFIKQNKLEGIYFLNYYSLILQCGFFDDATPICLSKKENNYSLITLGMLKEDFKNSSEIKFFQEGHAVSGRADTIDGYVIMNSRIGIKELVQEDEKHKIVSLGSLLTKTLDDIWGAHSHRQVDVWREQNFSLDGPYHTIEVYSKKELI